MGTASSRSQVAAEAEDKGNGQQRDQQEGFILEDIRDNLADGEEQDDRDQDNRAGDRDNETESETLIVDLHAELAGEGLAFEISADMDNA